jgi:hypothetical protein
MITALFHVVRPIVDTRVYWPLLLLTSITLSDVLATTNCGGWLAVHNGGVVPRLGKCRSFTDEFHDISVTILQS